MTWQERVVGAIHESIAALAPIDESPSVANLRESLHRALANADGLPVHGPDPVIATLRGAMGALLIVEDVPDERVARAIGDAIQACLDRPGRTTDLDSDRPPSVRHQPDCLRVSTTAPECKRVPVVAWRRSSLPPPSAALVVVDAENDVHADDEVPLERPLVASAYADEAPKCVSDEPVRRNDGGDPITREAFFAQIVAECLETLAMLGRDRAVAPLEQVATAEARALVRTDAIAASGGRCVGDVVAWWEAAREIPDPWKGWSALFALGTLHGLDAMRACAHVLTTLPDDAPAYRDAAVDALLVVPHGDLSMLVGDLLDSPHATARAAGVELAGVRGLIDDRLEEFLLDGHPSVAAAAVRAARTRDWPPNLKGWIQRLVSHPSADVAWEACVALATRGSAEPWFEWRRRGRLARVLGCRAAELLVLFGDVADASLLEELLRLHEPTPETLSCIGRFGNVAAFSYLAHHLSDDDLAAHAASALTTLFGECVPRTESADPAAWRAAIARGRFDPTQRYRRGLPWRPSVVAAECTSGALSRTQCLLRLEELAVRTGLPVDGDLRAWFPELTTRLNAALGNAKPADSTWVPGAWACRTAW